MIVFDSVYPENRATSDVTINVIRNPSGPAFLLPQYVVVIPDSYQLGRNITQVAAIDSDGVSTSGGPKNSPRFRREKSYGNYRLINYPKPF